MGISSSVLPHAMGWRTVIQLMLVYLAKETCKKSKGVLDATGTGLHMCVDRIQPPPEAHTYIPNVEAEKFLRELCWISWFMLGRPEKKKWKLKHFNQSPLWRAPGKFFASMCPWTFHTFSTENIFPQNECNFLSHFLQDQLPPCWSSFQSESRTVEKSLTFRVQTTTIDFQE